MIPSLACRTSELPAKPYHECLVRRNLGPASLSDAPAMDAGEYQKSSLLYQIPACFYLKGTFLSLGFPRYIHLFPMKASVS